MADMEPAITANRRSNFRWFLGFWLFAATGLFSMSCDAPVQQVSITVQDFRFDPDTIHLSSERPIHLTVFNQGREAHTFESTLWNDPSVRIEATLAGVSPPNGPWRILPGETLEVRLRAPQGFYHFSCAMRGHTGMRGIFIIGNGISDSRSGGHRGGSGDRSS